VREVTGRDLGAGRLVQQVNANFRNKFREFAVISCASGSWSSRNRRWFAKYPI